MSRMSNKLLQMKSGLGPDDFTVTDGDTLFHNFPIGTYRTPVFISGVKSDTLRIENIPYSMNGYKY